MKYIKAYESYTIENFDSAVCVCASLVTGLIMNSTYTMGVTMLMPIVDALIKNSNIPNITSEQLVLLVLFSIAQILHVNTEDVKKIQIELEKENLLPVAEKVKKSLESIHKIYSFVLKSFGKILNVFTDTLAYVALGVPLAYAVKEIVSQDGLNLDTLPQKVLVVGGGAAFFAFKNLIDALIIIVKNKINSKKQM